MSERIPSALTTGQPAREAATGVLQVVGLEAAEHDWEISPGMAVHGYAFNGPHHEIYLSDPRKVEPARLRTILRQPVKRRDTGG